MPMTDSIRQQTWRVTPDLLGFVDRAGCFVETNPAWQATLGWGPDEIRSMTCADFLHPDDRERTNAVFAGLQDGRPALHFENRYRHRDGSYRWLSWVAVPEGEVFYCSARDVTRDKAQSRALKTSEDEAVLREQFIAILGHDLRNPLAAISSAARIARRDPQGDRVGEMLDSIEGSTRRMARLIDATMDFARARLGGGIPVEMVPGAGLREGFEQVIGEIRLGHPDREIRFDYAVPGTVRCDPGRLDQMLSNLVVNAVTHGGSGEPIAVSAREEGGCFVLSVTNRGAPIPADVLGSLFEPFARTEGGTSLHGLGLGLYIVAQIAAAHGGTIDARSDAEETCFTFRMPLD